MLEPDRYYSCPICGQASLGETFNHHVIQCQKFAEYLEKKRQIDSDARMAAFLQQQTEQLSGSTAPPMSAPQHPFPTDPRHLPHRPTGPLRSAPAPPSYGFAAAPPAGPAGFAHAPPPSYPGYGTVPPSYPGYAAPPQHYAAPPGYPPTRPGPPHFQQPVQYPQQQHPPHQQQRHPHMPTQATPPPRSAVPPTTYHHVPPPRSVVPSAAQPPARPPILTVPPPLSPQKPPPTASSPSSSLSTTPTKPAAAAATPSSSPLTSSTTSALASSFEAGLRLLLPSVPLKATDTSISNLPSVPQTQPHAAPVNPARKREAAPPRKHAPAAQQQPQQQRTGTGTAGTTVVVVEEQEQLPSQHKREEPLSDGLTGREMVHLDNMIVTQLSHHMSTDDEMGVIEGHLTMILTLRDHPLGAMLNNAKQRFVGYFQSVNPAEYTEEVALRTSEDIWEAGNEIVFATTCHYKEFNLKRERQMCASNTICNALWRLVTPAIIDAYCTIYQEQDAQHDAKIAEMINVLPNDLGIREIFWLQPHEQSSSSSTTTTTTPIDEVAVVVKEPYAAALLCLQKLANSLSPGTKCQCLVDTAQAICQAIQVHWKGRKDNEALIVGGDDLLPLMTLMIIRARVPHLYVHAKYMEHFMEQLSAIQQHGYILATLQTALAFIACVQDDQLSSADSMSAMLSPTLTRDNSLSGDHAHIDFNAQQQQEQDGEGGEEGDRDGGVGEEVNGEDGDDDEEEEGKKRPRNRSIYLLHQDDNEGPPPYIEVAASSPVPVVHDPFELVQQPPVLLASSPIQTPTAPSIQISSSSSLPTSPTATAASPVSSPVPSSPSPTFLPYSSPASSASPSGSPFGSPSSSPFASPSPVSSSPPTSSPSPVSSMSVASPSSSMPAGSRGKSDNIWTQLDQLSHIKPKEEVSSFDSLWDAAMSGHL